MAFFFSYIFFGHLLSEITIQSQVVPIWLPAGIALVGCYFWWWRFFPAVFIASYVCNFTITSNTELSFLSSELGIQHGIIAMGGTLQAVVGASILRFWLGNPFKHWKSSKTIYFVFIVGVFINLISASIGVYTLSVFNAAYPMEDYYLNLVYWWLGDSLGVLLMTPFILGVFHFKRASAEQQKTRLTILSSVSILFVIVTLITRFSLSTFAIDSKALVKKETQVIENSIYSQIAASVNQLRVLADFIQHTPDMDKESFNQFVTSFYRDSESIKAMSWNPIISQKDRVIHDGELAQIYANNVMIKGEPLLENDPIVYVKWITPELGNKKAIGFNVYSNESRKQTLKSAIESYQPKATPIIQLVQSDKKEPAFLLFYPVFEKLHLSDKGTAKKIKGFATGVFLVDKLLASSFTEEQMQLFYYEFFEQNQLDWFHSNVTTNGDKALTLTMFKDNHTDQFNVAGQQWNINLSANQAYMTRQQNKDFLFLYFLLVVIVVTIVTSLLLLNNRQLALDNIVKRRTRSLEKSTHEANYANQAKSQFLANMSHEIRTPMNSVVGFAKLAKDSSELNEIKHYLDNIAISSDLLLNIVNDILDISKIESEKLVLSDEVFEPSMALSRIYRLFESQANEKQLTWTLKDTLPQQLFVKGDKTRFEQILMNLCSNAIKFTHQGGVSLSASLLESVTGDAHIQIKVTDSGIGIADSQIKQLFEPFTQADASTSRDYGGTGLGLTISKKLSQLMNGDICVESIPNQGATFTFTCHLPKTESASVKGDVASFESGYQLNDLSSLKVLVAEDNRINQKLISTILAKLGIDAVIVENGQLAIDYVKQHAVDVILMDCQMPVLDGYDATSYIRSFPEFNHIAIFALTADVDTRSKEKAKATGFNKHLAKPINVDELTVCLQEVYIAVSTE